MYTIEVHYRTGNSFNTETCTEEIGLVWKDLKLAQKCLCSIKEHKHLSDEMDCSYGDRTSSEVFKDISSRSWFPVNDSFGKKLKPFDVSYAGCHAEMDDGSYRTVPTSMWMGYFEDLYWAKISLVQDDKNYISFN